MIGFLSALVPLAELIYKLATQDTHTDEDERNVALLAVRAIYDARAAQKFGDT